VNPFTWNDKYSLGRPDADAEHQALFRLAEQLYQAIDNGTAEDQLESLFARLASYVRFHFENEEILMRQIGFPDFEQHHQQHEGFIAKLSSLESLFRSGNTHLDNSLLGFLRNWLEQHVCGADQQFARYISASPVE
jgi:hemerythrin-like metal-binding protein